MSRWFIPAQDGLWMFDPDESGLVQLTADPVVYAAVAPHAPWGAYVTRGPSNGYRLNLVTLPEGEIVPVAELTSANTAGNVDVAAAIERESLAWSPDGRLLAFIGAQDGPSADLYVYSVDDGRASRLTDGPSQAFRPVWSPDGRYILHQGISHFSVNGGNALAGFWAARADGTGIKSLPTPDGSSGEWVVGWCGPGTAVVHSLLERGQRFGLRALDVDTGAVRSLWGDEFTGCAVDPLSGSVLVTVGADYLEQDRGIFLLRFGEAGAQRIALRAAAWVEWSPEAGLFLVALDGGTLAITPGGKAIGLSPVTDPMFPAVAPGGERWACGSSGPGLTGLFLGSFWGTEEPRQVWDEPAGHPVWARDSQRLIFFGGSDRSTLFLAEGPDFTPAPIAVNVRNGQILQS